MFSPFVCLVGLNRPGVDFGNVDGRLSTEPPPYAFQPVSAAGGHEGLIVIRYDRIFGESDGRPADGRSRFAPSPVDEMAIPGPKPAHPIECPDVYISVIFPQHRHGGAVQRMKGGHTSDDHFPPSGYRLLSSHRSPLTIFFDPSRQSAEDGTVVIPDANPLQTDFGICESARGQQLETRTNTMTAVSFLLTEKDRLSIST
jgi:hypothetical protein